MSESSSPDPLVSLARTAIESYVRDHRVAEALPLPDVDQTRAGVFVCLHLPDGSLRGCIGTFMPTQPTIGEEIVRNAISAATQDPRFRPVTEEELGDLDVSVDVLEPPEPVNGVEDLNPKVYGIIVRTPDGRQALLLPDLEGIDTADMQLRVTCRKGGIDPDRDSYSIYRFRVTRHE